LTLLFIYFLKDFCSSQILPRLSRKTYFLYLTGKIDKRLFQKSKIQSVKCPPVATNGREESGHNMNHSTFSSITRQQLDNENSFPSTQSLNTLLYGRLDSKWSIIYEMMTSCCIE